MLIYFMEAIIITYINGWLQALSFQLLIVTSSRIKGLCIAYTKISKIYSPDSQGYLATVIHGNTEDRNSLIILQSFSVP